MYKAQKQSTEERFNSYLVITPGCWLWAGYRDRSDYGIFSISGKLVRTHRYSYEKYIGEIPAGMSVCHSCDNPPCVNPDHLWLGTAKENSDDKMAKGRWSNGVAKVGEENPMARLTEADVYAIRADSRSSTELAQIYKTTATHIRGVKTRHAWKHLPARECDVPSVDGRARSTK